MPDSASQLAENLVTDTEVEAEDEVLPDADEDTEESDDEVSEDDLPPQIKAILKKNRTELRETQKELRTLKRQVKGQPVPEELAAGETARADKFQSLYVKNAAKAALLQAGLQGAPDRFVRMLDLDALEIADDGTIDGLDEQIDEIKGDFEDMFVVEKPRIRRRMPGDGAPRPSAPVKKSSAEILAERALGR